MEMEEGYRRGTVLGLTIAEIFILLVFLMLLALLGMNRYWNDKLDPWRGIIEENTPAEVELALMQPDEHRREIERLNNQIEELKKEKDRLQDRIRTLVAREGTVGEKLDETKRLLEECEKALEDAKRRIETLMIENLRLRGRNDALENQVRMIGKGNSPPCWYEIVGETNPITKANWRERAYYLFDIVIREDHMEVQPVPIPEGRAEDDGGRPYAEEAKVLTLEAIPYGEPLTNEEMRKVMRRLHEQGKASQVRTYSCAFYVRVWDETATTAKGRWKRAHDEVLEQLFGTYQVRDISWSGRNKNPANVPMNARVEGR